MPGLMQQGKELSGKWTLVPRSPGPQVLTLRQGLAEQALSSPLSRTKQACGDPVFLCSCLSLGPQPMSHGPGALSLHRTHLYSLWGGRAFQYKAQL